MRRRMFLLGAGALLSTRSFQLHAALGAGSRAEQAMAATIVDLGDGPPALTGFEPTALNDAGQVVGTANDDHGDTVPVLWQAGSARAFSLPPGMQGHPWDINAAGMTVGSIQGNGQSDIVLWTSPDALPQSLTASLSDVFYATVQAIADSGASCGGVQDVAKHMQAIVWSADGVTLLSVPDAWRGQSSFAAALDGQGTVVGSVGDVPNERAVVWRDGVPTVLEPSIRSTAQGILADGGIVGSLLRPAAGGMGALAEIVLWRDDAVTSVARVEQATTNLAGVAADGRILYTVIGAGAHDNQVMLWQNGGATDLATLLPPDSGWQLRDAVGLTTGGLVAGSGTRGDAGARPYLLTLS